MVFCTLSRCGLKAKCLGQAVLASSLRPMMILPEREAFFPIKIEVHDERQAETFIDKNTLSNSFDFVI